MVSELFLAIQNKKPRIDDWQVTEHQGAHCDPATASGISCKERSIEKALLRPIEERCIGSGTAIQKREGVY
jgi:hypothetical protein